MTKIKTEKIKSFSLILALLFVFLPFFQMGEVKFAPPIAQAGSCYKPTQHCCGEICQTGQKADCTAKYKPVEGGEWWCFDCGRGKGCFKECKSGYCSKCMYGERYCCPCVGEKGRVVGRIQDDQGRFWDTRATGCGNYGAYPFDQNMRVSWSNGIASWDCNPQPYYKTSEFGTGTYTLTLTPPSGYTCGSWSTSYPYGGATPKSGSGCQATIPVVEGDWGTHLWFFINPVVQPTPTVDIKANGSDGPITIPYNTSANLTWASTNATFCYASGGWSGWRTTSGSASTRNLTSSRTYTITCTGLGGSASDSVTVNVLPPACPYQSTQIRVHKTDTSPWVESLTLYPNETFKAGIFKNNWGVSVSDGRLKIWGPNYYNSYDNGSALDLYENLSLPNTGTYTIRGEIKGHENQSGCWEEISVQVIAYPSPTVDIKANLSDGSITIPYNTSATLSWTSTNATFCAASGAWSGSKSIYGSEATGNLTSSKTYTLTCTGPGGQASDSVQVNVSSQPCPYQSTQVRVHKTDTEPWATSLTLYPNEKFKAGIFKNDSGVLVSDGRLKIWGPNFSQSYDNGGALDLYENISLLNVGTYTIRGEIKGHENQSGCWEEISVQVISCPCQIIFL